MSFKDDFYNDKLTIKDKVIIITGATGLLGQVYVKSLSELGSKIVGVDINEEALDNLEKQVNENVLLIKADITNEDQVKNILRKTIERFEKVDGLLNNACYNPQAQTPLVHGPLSNFPLDEWDKFLAVNLTGIFLCVKIIGEWMAENGGGVIVNVSSIYGVVGADQRIYGNSGINSNLAYATTKGGVLNMTRWLASYWHKNNVRVNTFTPGGVFNNQDAEFHKNYNNKTMLGRMAEKDEYVGAILFLFSDASKYMNGANLVFDGGWTAW